MLRSIERLFKFSSFVAGYFCLSLSLAATAQTLDERINAMSAEEKVGQLMVWTFSGTEMNSATKALIEDHRLGSLIAFSRNIKSNAQIAKFNALAQRLAARKLKAPLFLMVDQEGGTVTRVKLNTPIPSALALGRYEDLKFIEDYAKTSAELLMSLGFNVNLAPVLDLSNTLSDTFIGNRAFGENPEKVAEMGTAYATGISSAGMLPTAKHFPGHGGNIVDSHHGLATKPDALNELTDRDWQPFQKFIEQRFPKAIMMAHIALPKLDPSGLPATYSSVIIGKFLRTQLGFDGLIITDDLEMSGAGISKDVGERAVRAFLAGNDLLMLAGSIKNQRRAYNRVLKAVKSGRISRERLNESVKRILTVKLEPKYTGFEFMPQTTRELKLKVEGLSKQIMQHSFKKSVDSSQFNWPSLDSKNQVLVLSPDQKFSRNFDANFEGRLSFIHLTPRNLDEARRALAKKKFAFAVYYATGSKTARWLTSLPDELKTKLLVINCNHPGKIASPNKFLGVLDIASHSPESGGWLAQVLKEKSEIRTPAEATRNEP